MTDHETMVKLKLQISYAPNAETENQSKKPFLTSTIQTKKCQI